MGIVSLPGSFDYFIAKEYGGTGKYELKVNQIIYKIDLIGGGTESNVMQYYDSYILMDLYGYKIEWNRIQ